MACFGISNVDSSSPVTKELDHTSRWVSFSTNIVLGHQLGI